MAGVGQAEVLPEAKVAVAQQVKPVVRVKVAVKLAKLVAQQGRQAAWAKVLVQVTQGLSAVEPVGQVVEPQGRAPVAVSVGQAVEPQGWAVAAELADRLAGLAVVSVAQAVVLVDRVMVSGQVMQWPEW